MIKTMFEFLKKNISKDRFPWISILIVLMCFVVLLFFQNKSYKNNLIYAQQREIKLNAEIDELKNLLNQKESQLQLRSGIHSKEIEKLKKKCLNYPINKIINPYETL